MSTLSSIQDGGCYSQRSVININLHAIHSSCILHLTMPATELINTYQHTLTEILNGLAPAVNKAFKDRQLSP